MKYIIDLDGTLLDGTKANLDAVSFIQTLQKKQLDFLIMTNSVKSPSAVEKRLSDVGISVEKHQIINPISAMNIYLKARGYKKVYIIGSEKEKTQVDAEITDDQPEAILLLDFEKENIGYSELQKIFQMMEDDIPVFTASKSQFYLKGGKKQLDTGAFVTLLEAVSSRPIEVIGKPSEIYFKSALDQLNSAPNEVMVIGDDWRTDITGALKMGCHATLVKSGKYLKGDEQREVVKNFATQLMDILNE